MDTTILRTFVAILDDGSFAAAARKMGISRSLCSKYISDLEEDLGVRLLMRTTRSVRPTVIGQEYGQRIREVLRQLDAANEGVRAASGNPAGTLKVGAPITYTLKSLQAHLIDFMDLYPSIELELVLDDGTSNLVDEGYAAVIRIGVLRDSTLHARRLDDVRIMMVAAPEYLDQRGTPTEPQHLLQHSCLHYNNLREAETWQLQRDGEPIYQKVQPVFSSNSTEMLQQMALSGRGIAMMPEFAVADDIAAGRLVPIMHNYVIPALPVHLLYPTGKLMTAALRSFLDHFAKLRLG
ncbi:LysR family transcriptional regulator [Paracoccus homiensis]|nr:LysR family transcriptional regulator [Paracoccus homiensis]